MDRANASDAELAYLNHMDVWSESAAYVTAHLHQADTLAAAFVDSPVGLLAWLAEKYDSWSDRGVPDDDILAATSLMWLTDTFRSSVRLYSEPAATWAAGSERSMRAGTMETTLRLGAMGKRLGVRGSRCLALAVFSDDIGVPPRDFCDRFFAVSRYTAMPRGGHWAALEEPALVAEDLTAFAASL